MKRIWLSLALVMLLAGIVSAAQITIGGEYDVNAPSFNNVGAWDVSIQQQVGVFLCGVSVRAELEMLMERVPALNPTVHRVEAWIESSLTPSTTLRLTNWQEQTVRRKYNDTRYGLIIRVEHTL